MKKTNKRAIAMIICSLLALSILAAILIYSTKKQESYAQLQLEFIEVESVYEVETSLEPIEFIKSSSENITEIQYPFIDSSKVGEHVFVFLAYDSYGNQKEFPLLLNFSDPILPVLELTVGEIEIIEGSTIELISYVAKAEDPIDGKLDVKIEKPDNYKNVGSHEIIYRVEDKNGNTVSSILRLTVKEKRKEEEKQVSSENGAENGSNQAVEAINEATTINNNTQQSQSQKPSNRKFMLGEFDPVTNEMYDMNNTPRYCESYITSHDVPGRCSNIYDGSMPIGQEAIFY